jgi:hypothetical protein
MGDNITPPQQAFNWVADVYGSTDEIKARGQVIVGLLHRTTGHLGIFVSGSVARKEHAQIVSVMKSIEALPPGLYGMEIREEAGPDGEPAYTVEFREQRLEDMVERGNRFKRLDEKPFEAVEAISDFNQRAYELFAQPLVQSLSNELSARLQRDLHPLRVERSSWSDLNPFLAWLGPAADRVRADRQVLDESSPIRRAERMMSEIVSASLDYYRAMRDATSEAVFFQAYGNIFALYMADRQAAERQRPKEAEELPFVRDALAAIERGGYAEALARIAALLDEDNATIPLAQIELKAELMREYADLLPDLQPDEMRRIRGEQDIIVRYARGRAIDTLPQLLQDPADRARLMELVRRLRSDPRMLGHVPTRHDAAVMDMVMRRLGPEPARRARLEAKKTKARNG